MKLGQLRLCSTLIIMDYVFRMIQQCNQNIFSVKEIMLPLCILCFTVVNPVLKAKLVPCEVFLFIAQQRGNGLVVVRAC